METICRRALSHSPRPFFPGPKCGEIVTADKCRDAMQRLVVGVPLIILLKHRWLDRQFAATSRAIKYSTAQIHMRPVFTEKRFIRMSSAPLDTPSECNWHARRKTDARQLDAAEMGTAVRLLMPPSRPC